MLLGNKKAILAFVLVVALTGCAFYVGFLFGSDREPAVSPTASDNASSTHLSIGTSVLWEAVKEVKENYYDLKDVTDEKILYGAAKGILDSLGDPYSVFLSPTDSEKFNQDLSGNFGGVGMEIGIRNSQLVVIAPLKGNPAEAVGLKAGDQIISINGTSTAGMSTDAAVKLIRGEVGTDVKLSIFREGWKAPRDFKITRANIQVPTLDWEMKEENIAYIQLHNFNANASSLFYNAALSSLINGAKGVILDLRNDPGGYLDTAVSIAGWFLERGVVVVRENLRSGNENVLVASGPAALANLPIVVIVNGGSASASEILAGALQDQRGIKLVGEKTFGKGSVQEIRYLSGGASVKISVAEWLTPKGRQINKKGIEPDIAVKFPEDGIINKNDPQLDKALEVIKQEMAK
jgi:carboxyl-terminal processing protease